nr:hypothetical protein [Riemerella anatipestifer]
MATIKKLQTLFSKKGFTTEERHEVIYNFTNGRTSSSRELNRQELIDLCNALEGIKKVKRNSLAPASPFWKQRAYTARMNLS